MMQIFIAAIFFNFWLFFSGDIFAQTTEARQKTQELAASLSKTKYKHKTKGSFEFEKYIDIKSEAVVKNNAAEYAGNYESEDSNYRIQIRVTNGKIEGNGYNTNAESSKREKFVLSEAKIQGALLTANVIYESGKAEKFEAVFINRIIVEGTNPNKIEFRATDFGLGFIQKNGDYTQRVFCKYKP